MHMQGISAALHGVSYAGCKDRLWLTKSLAIVDKYQEQHSRAHLILDRVDALSSRNQYHVPCGMRGHDHPHRIPYFVHLQLSSVLCTVAVKGPNTNRRE